IKDRQYTTQADSVARRSAQTALYHLTQAFVRWMSPILSFTAQEAWSALAEPTSKYVFTAEWYTLPVVDVAAQISDDDWQTILQVKAAVNKQIENARNAKLIGANLSAQVVLWADERLQTVLAKLGDELRFVLITSAARVETFTAQGEATELTGLRVQVSPADGVKCARCWHVRSDVGSHTEHPELCGRCIDNVTGNGEVRHYA
ncbi:MAG: class I tRNA ligase family protein, partial [Flavobacteriales bacterium]